MKIKSETEYELIIPDDTSNKRPQHKIRNDIQTLRAFAIIFVLLFHVWPSKIKYGYLGVDMFFVISGYLIFGILAKKQPIDYNKILTFYYARIKRIVPLYLFVVFLTLLCIYYLISPIEFTQIVRESLPALGFYSNFPNTRKTGYFDNSSKFYFFLHSWSLAVELQFYLLVPILFIFIEWLTDMGLKVFLTILIALISFVYQLISGGDASHMFLWSRLWQFFAGFFAYYAYEKELFKSSKNETNRYKMVFNEFIALICILLLILLFIYDVTIFNRLFVIIITALLISCHNENRIILTNSFTALIGNVSYSIYLIHWPLFTWHRYANSESYSIISEADLTTGTTLIMTSITLGFLVEKSFKSLLKYINGWNNLLIILFIGYSLNFLLLFQLKNNSINVYEEDFIPLSAEREQELYKEMKILWETQNETSEYTNEQILLYNAHSLEFQQKRVYCKNKDPVLPTKFPFNINSYRGAVTSICHGKGIGNKNIILLGNSHMTHNYLGIQASFGDVYENMTMIAHHSCVITQVIDKQPARVRQTKIDCVRYVNEIILTLEQWEKPIDIIFAFFPFLFVPDEPINEDLERDEIFKDMKKFYSKLSKIAKDAVILVENLPYFREDPIHSVAARMQNEKSLKTVGNTREELLDHDIFFRLRSEFLECKNCIKLKFIDNWCGPELEDFCSSVREDGLVYFYDKHHPSVIGSMLNGKFIRNQYDNFTKSLLK